MTTEWLVKFTNCRERNAIGIWYPDMVKVNADTEDDAIDEALKLRESSGGIFAYRKRNTID